MSNCHVNMLLYIRTCEYLKRINDQGLVVFAVNLDDRQIMSINCEVEVWIARDGDQAKAVAIWYQISSSILIGGKH